MHRHIYVVRHIFVLILVKLIIDVVVLVDLHVGGVGFIAEELHKYLTTKISAN